MSRSRRFPSDFLWGAATSSHQVEGGNKWNDWWEYETKGRLPYASGDACRHYELYEKDFDLACAWGHNAHRFSIEWSRIEPSPGKWNYEAVEHYREVIRALKRRGLEPVITLHHFTNPAWFTRRGGWTRRDSVRLFARYVAYVVEQLGQQIKYWLTLNEPTVYVMQGYLNGVWPPCLKNSRIKAAVVFRNLARSHVVAYQKIHEFSRDAMVGFAHSAPLIIPCKSTRKRDRVTALIRDAILTRAFFFLIGARGKSSRRTKPCLDFIGINYYTRSIIRSVGWGAGALVGRTCDISSHNHNGPISDMGWEIYPAGLLAVLERFSCYGVPIFITENGIATSDESLRSNFIIEHLKVLAEALGNGIDVIGYFYWTLMDNYEWSAGTDPHFGLAAVDRTTQRRAPRPCVEIFKRYMNESHIHSSV